MTPFRCWECRGTADERLKGWKAYRADLPGDPEPILLFYCGPCAERVFDSIFGLKERDEEPAG